MPHLCPIPKKDDVADDIEIICTSQKMLGPTWGCDECPDLEPWRKLHGRRMAYIEGKLAVHRPGILKKAKERIR